MSNELMYDEAQRQRFAEAAPNVELPVGTDAEVTKARALAAVAAGELKVTYVAYDDDEVTPTFVVYVAPKLDTEDIMQSVRAFLGALEAHIDVMGDPIGAGT